MAFGHDPVIEGFDQQPMHFNESGSRMKTTLEWEGQSDVPLKERGSQTRERWTMNTHVRSKVRAVGEWPPLGIVFKGGPVVAANVERTFRSLCAGGDYGVRSHCAALAC